MKKDTFGAILKKEIKSKGFTQEIFAEKIGIGHATLKKYLSPKYNRYPNVELLLKICAVLECDSDYLLGLQPHPRKETTDICSITGLSPAAVEALKFRKRVADSEGGLGWPGTLELKALNCILEHGLSDDGCMRRTVFSYIGYILFSHFVDARLANTEDRKIPINGTNMYFISPSGKDKITLRDEVTGADIEFLVDDLALSQMENVRQSIYLLKDELSKSKSHNTH